MRLTLTTVFLTIIPALSFAEDSPCLRKYKIISEQFYQYNEVSAASNAAMDHIADYNTESHGKLKIRPADAERWKESIKNFLTVANPLLQNLMEYKAYGCSPNDQAGLNNMIQKAREDIKYAMNNINYLLNEKK